MDNLDQLLEEAKATAAAKAKELSEQMNIRVHPLVFITDSKPAEVVVGYIKEPSRAVKIAVMDKSLVGMYSAASEALEGVLLKEHSDPRMLSERPEDDSVYLGAVLELYNLIKVSMNMADKKK
jgi:hypothetical protein